jgi:hypothetical protein
MSLPTRTFQQYTNDAVVAWAAALNLNPTLISGDPLLAIMQATAANDIFLQNLALQLNQLARASTAVGGDLDTWMADFAASGFAGRLPATMASGPVTLSVLAVRSTATSIPVGSIIQTSGGAIQYQLIADTAQAAYSAAAAAYILPAGQLSITATAQALIAGSASNVQAGQLGQLGFSGGPDTVTNLAAITNGLDFESDAALRIRFINFINNLARATKGAILSAIANIQQGLNANVIENTKPDGTTQLGFFTTVLDDGSGSPPAALLLTAQNILDGIRAFTIQQTVVAPQIVPVTVQLNIRVSSTAIAGPIQLLVQNAIVNYINSVGIGQPIYFLKLIQVAIDASPGNVLTVQVSSELLNGGGVDLTPTGFQLYKTTLPQVAVWMF